MAAQSADIQALATPRPSLTAPSVVVDAVSKDFRISHHSVATLKERVLHPFRSGGFDQINALNDVSFEIGQGEFFAIIGRNGSGKSTLLKCLAGIYRPDTGSVSVHGRLSPFIELGVGFNPDLNARDNVTINATLIGLSPSEARRRFDEVIAFAELQDFVNMKLKNYSSGMQVRLGFATAIQVDADILLVDEVLAVGDALFQRKCFDTFRRLMSEGRTIIYVSHDLATVREFADRVLLLDQGCVIGVGEAGVMIAEYERRNLELEDRLRAESGIEHENRVGDGAAEIVDAWFEDSGGERVSVLSQGESVVFKFRVHFHRDMTDPVLGFNIKDEQENLLLNVNNVWAGQPSGYVAAGSERTFAAGFQNWLAGGQHYASPIVAHADGQRWADLCDRLVRFEVEAPIATGGLVDFPLDVDVHTE